MPPRVSLNLTPDSESHIQELAESYRALREESLHTDLIICCDDGKRISVHSVVLARHSKTLKKIFLERQCCHCRGQDCTRDGMGVSAISLTGVTSASVKSLLELIYVGRVYLTEVTRRDLSQVVEVMGIDLPSSESMILQKMSSSAETTAVEVIEIEENANFVDEDTETEDIYTQRDLSANLEEEAACEGMTELQIQKNFIPPPNVISTPTSVSSGSSSSTVSSVHKFNVPPPTPSNIASDIADLTLMSESDVTDDGGANFVTPVTFHCHLCGKLFGLRVALQRHYRDHHRPNILKVDTQMDKEAAKQNFKGSNFYDVVTNGSSLNNKQKSVIICNKTEMLCSKCHRIFKPSDKKLFESHIQECQGSKENSKNLSSESFKCNFCGTAYSREFLLRAHLVNCQSLEANSSLVEEIEALSNPVQESSENITDSVNFKQPDNSTCPLCQKTYPSVVAVRSHLAQVHFREQLLATYPIKEGKRCPVCEKSSTSNYFIHIGVTHRKLIHLLPPLLIRIYFPLPTKILQRDDSPQIVDVCGDGGSNGGIELKRRKIN